MRDLTGQRFGRWAVLAEAEARNGKRRWVVRCDCGAERVSFERPLVVGESQSCGCLRRELLAAPRKHGATTGGQTAPEYHSWRCMIARCYYSKDRYFDNYGGRGITVCDRWRLSYAAFREDMGQRPPGCTLDRVNVDGPYEPGNCRWATPREQGIHRTDNRMITVNGDARTLTEWSEHTGLAVSTIWRRLRRGWSAERAIATPVGRG